uniref:CRISPR system precrRNA processing endoribonuclease RAMP protein Cas6 n=1 Tax=Mycobacterium tuberculosis TaxID=1773 RepID=UPI002A5ACD70|nr:CRISPR system precrRNA processing endoribonuclease RAMP protein Cas6 [Mycobacterium tuberculosis]
MQLSTAKSPILASSPNSVSRFASPRSGWRRPRSRWARRVFPGFTGSATFTVRGVDTFASYIAALLWFGEFSGCGIKASMGMGAIRVQPLAPREKCVPKP